MTTRETWLALAERCEAAKGPDREISEGILSALGYARISDAHWFCEGKGHWNDGNRIAASLDAITALIERELPGCGWSVDRSPSDAKIAGSPVLPEAFIMQHGDEWTYEGWPLCKAHTPVLALCAAFCRAMAERMNDDLHR